MKLKQPKLTTEELSSILVSRFLAKHSVNPLDDELFGAAQHVVIIRDTGEAVSTKGGTYCFGGRSVFPAGALTVDATTIRFPDTLRNRGINRDGKCAYLTGDSYDRLIKLGFASEDAEPLNLPPAPAPIKAPTPKPTVVQEADY